MNGSSEINETVEKIKTAIMMDYIEKYDVFYANLGVDPLPQQSITRI